MSARGAGLAGAAIALTMAGAVRAAEPSRAEEIVQSRCFLCHGVEGESSSPVFPRLAGQHAGYLARQMADYKSGRRPSGTMQPMVEDLSAADMAALGAYFASRRPRAHAVENAELAQRGRAIYLRGKPEAGMAPCASCHGVDGAGNDAMPRLAGQHAQYAENQLRAFNQRERSSDKAVMHGIASKLSEHEIKAVAAYISSLGE